MYEHPDPAVSTLMRQVQSLRVQVQRQEELLDTLATPPWKRLWFLVQGWRLWRVGRWRRLRWEWER